MPGVTMAIDDRDIEPPPLQRKGGAAPYDSRTDYIDAHRVLPSDETLRVAE